MQKKPEEKPDLTKVNSTLAAKILIAIKAHAIVPHLLKTAAPPSKYELLGQKLNSYKNAVDSKLKETRDKAIINLVFITATFVFLILAIVFSNLASLVGSVGLGTTSVVAQTTSWKDTLIAYVTDSGTLKRQVEYLEGEYKSCDPSDDAQVKKIDDMIESDFGALDKAQAA
ncbi:MAG: hypothetical protein ABR909_09620 [Candidatus Bathyarchaeia archaeon]|jgi:hypothetical protein